MDVIAKARELGHAIQQDATYANMMAANEICDACSGLQERVDNFNRMRAVINTEIMKDEKDSEKIAKLDTELKAEYEAIMAIPEMVKFNDAKATFSELIEFVNQIISQSVNGENPDFVEKESSCGGSCSSCGGCH